ncbi:hypothetical protein NP233_g9179 [Leucocoprinus birnbaumii]|uniref:Phosphoinositide phospholipase C n=1 Tax=Leucocoprinus birnbaumii TaxID=56174 RepID=A0AAD5VRK7_9AGAR|nr:hypothetical protein NP233_g9179 [Leucocoprinus birnbaumii]
MHKAKDKAKRLSARFTGQPVSSPIADIAGSLPGPITTDGTDLSVPDALQRGSEMLKISDKKEKRVVFKLNPDAGHLSYQSSKHGVVPIEAIKEIRTGENTKYDCQRFKKPEEWESRWLTIIYIIDGSYKTLHIVADTRDVIKQWQVSLRKLYAIRQGLITGLGKVELRETIWERQYWKGADREGDHKLVFDEILGLCRRLNVSLSQGKLESLFKEADTQHRGYLDFNDYQRFVKALKYRPELNALYASVTSTSKKLDYTAFKTFMLEIQKSTLPDSDIRSIFLKSAHARTLTDNTTLTLDQFSSFLLSPDNSIFSEANKGIWQDMTRPLSDYYLSSSHNTYLVGHQLVGVSTIEGYIRALLHSCRTVELDIYDGDPEPIIYHGNTLTSKVALRDICQAIAKYAFVTSPYPVIISAEVHCSLGQQEKLVDVMIGEFGDKLVRVGDDGSERSKLETLPSPEELKHKILVKAKNLFIVAELASQKAAHDRQLALALSQSSSPQRAHRENTLSSLLSFVSTSDESSKEKHRQNSGDDSEEGEGKGGGGLKEELKEELKSTWRKFKNRHSGSHSPSRSPPKSSSASAPAARMYLSPSPPAPPPSSSPIPIPIPALTLTKSPSPGSPTTKSLSSSPAQTSVTKPKMSLRLVELLVYTVGVKCHGVGSNSGISYAPEYMFSVSENYMNRLIKAGRAFLNAPAVGVESIGGKVRGGPVGEMVRHTQRNLVRVYPKGMRVNSSNYVPHRYWAAGAQIVAINWQTFDLGYTINQAMFSRNGRCGYVLKPLALRKEGEGLLSVRKRCVLDITIISAQQLPRPRDHNTGQEIITSSVVDPYVEVTLHTPDFSSPPSPSSSSSNLNLLNELTNTSSSPSSSTRISKRTKVVKNNGFNPVWNEELKLEFESVGGLEGRMRELMFLEVRVGRKGEEGEDAREAVAVWCSSLGAIQFVYNLLFLFAHEGGGRFSSPESELCYGSLLFGGAKDWIILMSKISLAPTTDFCISLRVIYISCACAIISSYGDKLLSETQAKIVVVWREHLLDAPGNDDRPHEHNHQHQSKVQKSLVSPQEYLFTIGTTKNSNLIGCRALKYEGKDIQGDHPAQDLASMGVTETDYSRKLDWRSTMQQDTSVMLLNLQFTRCPPRTQDKLNTHPTLERSDFAGFSGKITGMSVEERNQLEEQLEEIRRKLAERKARKKQTMALTGDRPLGETKIPVLSQGCPATYLEQTDGVSTPVAEALPISLIPERGATCNLAPAPPDSEPPPYDSLVSGSSDPVITE